jgi:hypothetical protein
MKEKITPFLLGVLYCAHHINLTIKNLFKLELVHHYRHFYNPSMGSFPIFQKKYGMFQKLVETIKLTGNKFLKNMKTKWINMFYG